MGQTNKFFTGDWVRVRVDSPTHHFRTPTYIQGKKGRVVALCGVFSNPESLAQGGSGLPQIPLYRVEFPQTDVWAAYDGRPGDTVLVDIYEHWLNPAT
ncbi:MAG: hypothetical protein BZY88_18080 [SAR202 cluster bacterium Io17-Chloro-G9]|nr:MAG: hypothetical protein BZY88_18080 [SAR202 cluster bacterium Io17-Chloro-G9]